MLPKTAFKMGEEVRDDATGVSGLVTAITVAFNGLARIHIQPPAKDNALVDGINCDEQTLTKIGDGIAARCAPLKDSPFENGDNVKEKIVGVKGTILDLIWFSNGCVHATLVLKDKFAEDGTPATMHVNVERLEKTGVSKAKLPPQEKPPGGPTTRGMSIR